jgi:UDPglucose--hexose-1-phosphate uridylyltransferase
MTPQEIGRLEDENGWYIRWFPNKFSAVGNKGELNVNTHDHFFTFADAIGKHEVIVESPKIEDELSDLSFGHIKDLLKVYNERIEELETVNGVRYVCVFKNHLPAAGTSIVHTHSQVIAYNIIPTFVMEKVNACKKYVVDPYEKIIEIEMKSDRRVFENSTFVTFCPYASRFPLETVIMPKRYVKRLKDFNDADLIDLAESIKNVLMKLKEIDAPYNMYLHYAPNGENLRFHISICPRLATWAGFEISSETIINAVSPEDAAEFLRKRQDKNHHNKNEE